jgi:hypothetical protein
MKKFFKSLFPIVGMIAFFLAIFFPAAGVIGAAMFITTSVNYGPKETYDYFIRPMFVGKSPWETQGVRVIPNVQSSQALNYFGTAQKILKTYAKGFNAATGTTYTQRTLTTARVKAEAADDGLEFYQTIFESQLNKADWNDITPTQLDGIIVDIYKKALAADIYRVFWMGDTKKELLTSGVQNGTIDPDYNQLDGMWKLIFENAATSPTDTQIKRIAVTDSAVAQVQTVSQSVDDAGAGTITIDGVAYAITRDTNATTTFNAFRTAHSAALLLRGYTLSGTSTLIITANKVGQPMATVTFAKAAADNFACTVAATTANTAPAALSVGEAEDIFNSLYNECDVVLKNVPVNEKVLLVDRTLYENYIDYLETLSTVTANLKLENGVQQAYYRGMPVIPMEWGLYLNADFPHAAGALPAYPHRAIYTQVGNLVLGLDVMNQYTEIRRWFNPDVEENRFRAKFNMGAQFVHNRLMCVAY